MPGYHVHAEDGEYNVIYFVRAQNEHDFTNAVDGIALRCRASHRQHARHL